MAIIHFTNNYSQPAQIVNACALPCALVIVMLASSVLAQQSAMADPVQPVLLVTGALDGETGKARSWVPLLCANGKGGLAVGSACLARAPAQAEIVLPDGTRRQVVRRDRVLACTHPYANEAPLPKSRGFVLTRGSAVNPSAALFPSGSETKMVVSRKGVDEEAPRKHPLLAGQTITAAVPADLDGDGVRDWLYVIHAGNGRGLPPRGQSLLGISGTDPTKTWRLRDPRDGLHTELVILAITDLDRDGKAEIAVYMPSVNDFGMAVFEIGVEKALHSYDCSNI